MKILLTAFEPFGGESENAALLAVERAKIDCAELYKLTVPTVFGKSLEVLKDALDSYCPDAVLCVGQAGGRKEITPERIAINCMDAKICDNAGNRPIDEFIRKDGPAAYFSTLPIRAMVKEMEQDGIPASISNSAGTFVCNQLMYGLLDDIATRKRSMIGGFLHVPYAEEQKREGFPSLRLGQLVFGIELSLKAIVLAKQRR